MTPAQFAGKYITLYTRDLSGRTLFVDVDALRQAAAGLLAVDAVCNGENLQTSVRTYVHR